MLSKIEENLKRKPSFDEEDDKLPILPSVSSKSSVDSFDPLKNRPKLNAKSLWRATAVFSLIFVVTILFFYSPAIFF